LNKFVGEEDLAAGKNGEDEFNLVFHPKPNGYYIGHAKSICLNFWFSCNIGQTNLRFDDTQP
jgi:glutamyl/glutaminyl-tRNA synthetase